ncbi:NAD(P)-dependent oxidoreductase [Ruminococcus sp. NK3A76]|uniref:NAD(P)-dependent oxidoreductase n=1 Tax=Ruminococcus sp. NK3A76 TaxID=877411 RepID=UPI00048D6A10|nr:NAD(P)-dependent oxidoreductase [Ruminococcus sp. NK3A76]
MTNRPLILAIKGDARQTYAVQSLKGYFNTTETQFPLSGAASADILLLPMLTKNGSFEGLSKHLRPGALVLGGRIPPGLRASFASNGYEVADYYESPSLKLQNALPTAEGVLMLAMQNTPGIVSFTSVLITGFGACAKQTARMFSALGCKVCIAARSPAARAEAEAYGYKTAEISSIKNIISHADIIVNTVPSQIIGEKELAASKQQALFIEIASAPFGIDESAAQTLGRKLINAPGLPAKCAPKTSGEYIARAVRDIIIKRKEGEP